MNIIASPCRTSTRSLLNADDDDKLTTTTTTTSSTSLHLFSCDDWCY